MQTTVNSASLTIRSPLGVITVTTKRNGLIDVELPAGARFTDGRGRSLGRFVYGAIGSAETLPDGDVKPACIVCDHGVITLYANGSTCQGCGSTDGWHYVPK